MIYVVIANTDLRDRRPEFKKFNNVKSALKFVNNYKIK